MSGSRDNSILQWDYRSSAVPTRKLIGHTQEVCGLKWSPDHQLLASGGNDNKLLLWNLSSPTPVKTYTEHTAAVKAIAWSPHQVSRAYINCLSSDIFRSIFTFDRSTARMGRQNVRWCNVVLQTMICRTSTSTRT